MNDRGKLNLGIVLIGLFAITIISVGAFSLASRASDNALPKAPTLQDSGGGSGEAPAAPGEKKPDEKPKEEPKPAGEAKDPNAAETPAAPNATQAPAADTAPKHDDSKTHRDQTPADLSQLGVNFKDEEGSQIADRTKKILEVNLPTAMQRKNDQARSYQTMNMEGRLDPLYVTDLIPDELRPELEGEGISGAVDSGLIDQLIQTQISTYFKFIPINIIGTMQNGPYKSALVSIPSLGVYQIMKEGEGFSFPAFPGDKGYYTVNLNVASIAEDSVTIVLSSTMLDMVYGRVLASTPAVVRHFYVRRYQ